MSYKKLPIDSQEEHTSKHVSSYSCGNCGEKFKISHKEDLPPKPTVCPNAFCREREIFTIIKKE